MNFNLSNYIFSNKKNIISNYFDMAILVFAFLFAFQFAGRCSIYLFILIVLFFCKNFFAKQTILIPKQILKIELFVALYCLVSGINFGFELSTLIQILFGIPLLYVIDYNMCYNSINKKFNLYLIFALAFGLFAHGFINLIFFDSAIGRNPINFWTGTILAATLQSSFFTITSALIIPILLFSKNYFAKIFVCGLFAIGIINSMETATRTGLYLPILIFLIMLVICLFYMRKNKKFIKKNSISFLLYILDFHYNDCI